MKCKCWGVMCLWCTYKAHLQVPHISWNSNTWRPPRPEQHLHLEQAKPIRVYTHSWLESSYQCRTGAPLYKNSRDYVHKLAFYLNRENCWKKQHLSFSDFIRSPPTWFVILIVLHSFINSCPILWFWQIYGISWRGQRSRGDEVLFASGTLAEVL